jgi:hypothetical protein
MTRLEKRFLSRRECFLCGMRLDQEGCQGVWERCTPEIRADRQRRCLETYKPRKRAPLFEKEKAVANESQTAAPNPANLRRAEG